MSAVASHYLCRVCGNGIVDCTCDDVPLDTWLMYVRQPGAHKSLPGDLDKWTWKDTFVALFLAALVLGIVAVYTLVAAFYWWWTS